MMRAACFLLSAMLGCSLPAFAGPEAFHPGTAIPGFGKIATIEDPDVTAESEFKITYDVGVAGEGDAINRKLETPARFLNMVVEAGVPSENVHLVVIVHGAASRDLLTEEARGAANPNAEMIAEMMKHNIRFILCGQTLAMRDIAREDLLPGVEVSLTAMTAHALLQQQGYTLNPF